VLRASIGDDALPAETMHVRAVAGMVALSGRVDLPYQRDEDEKVAREIPGVSDVRNELNAWMAVSPERRARAW